MRRLAVGMLLCGLLVGRAFAAAEPTRMTAAIPARAGDLVVCRLQTTGLPGEKLLQSMRSGLVSAVELDLAVIDDRDRLVADHHVTLRLAFDLWEEVFSVRSDGREQRFRSLEDLQAYLGELDGLPVVPVGRLGPEGRYRLRVGLRLHAIAPDERARVEDAIVGVRRPGRDGLDQQEAQVSLGRLIRFFYKGDRGDGEQEILSAWFTGREMAE